MHQKEHLLLQFGPVNALRSEELCNGKYSSVPDSAFDQFLSMLGLPSRSGTDAAKKRLLPSTRFAEGKRQKHDTMSPMKRIECAETEYKKENSDSDGEFSLGVNNEYAVDSSAFESSFNMHLGHKLSQVDVDDMSKRKWKYKWELPAIGMPNCRWIGTEECFLKDANDKAGYGLKLKLYKHWLHLYKTSGGNDFHSSKQRLFFTLCNSYRDILHCNKKPFYVDLQEDSNVMDAYVMHSLNHVLKTRHIVSKNDAKVGKHEEHVKLEILPNDNLLDQGFTRPKVLILLPYKSFALRFVRKLIELSPPSNKVNVEYMDRFIKEFGMKEVDYNEEKDKSFNDVEDDGNPGPRKSSKPTDYEALFGGDCNPYFMFGVKFTRRSIKLYSDFYSSDIIVASADALCSKIEEAGKVKEKDVDYLSSIEVLVIDYAEVMTMQNWDNVKRVVKDLNRIPSKQHGTDIMRIRKWYLDGYARFYRQTIILGSYLNPDINAVFNHDCFNYQGKVKLGCEYTNVFPKVLPQLLQIYERFDAISIERSFDARLEYFCKKIFPGIKDSVKGGIMIFVRSEEDVISIRNFLKSQSASFCVISDNTGIKSLLSHLLQLRDCYDSRTLTCGGQSCFHVSVRKFSTWGTKLKDISRKRNWFLQGRQKILVYTERMHFFYRYEIKGIQNIIFFTLPERKDFYPDIVNMLCGSDNMSCTALFSRFDLLQLERIVGTQKAKRMLESKNSVFVYC